LNKYLPHKIIQFTPIFAAYEQIGSNSGIATATRRLGFYTGACFGKGKASERKH
tara:strand:+ start:347 stop:508 length:162 start_codon:yes stop_codon:yes gene_type:complete